VELVLVQVRWDGREVPWREGWGQQGRRRREGGRRLQGAELALQRLTLRFGRSTLFSLMVELCVEVSDDFLQRLDVPPEVVGRRPRPLAADEARLVGRLGGRRRHVRRLTRPRLVMVTRSFVGDEAAEPARQGWGAEGGDGEVSGRGR